MKLTRKSLLETLRKKNTGWTTYQARKIAGISIRRVNQLHKIFIETGQIPEIGKKMGRPRRKVTIKERDIVKESYEKYRVSASTLERLIKRDYEVSIPHNHIHRILIILGYAKRKKKKDKRKKDWIRYQRRHSLTAVHIDWYYYPITEEWVFAVIDDASRKLLALVETDSPTTENSILGMKIALKAGKIKQCISDHGSQFTCNREGNSKFAKFCEKESIKQIFCKIKHPQSNGKVEKWFQVYYEHRDAFPRMEEFIEWYNEVRPHRSLKFEELETPQQAFLRKKKAEV